MTPEDQVEEARHRRESCPVCSGRAAREEQHYEIKRMLDRQRVRLEAEKKA